LNAIYYKWRGVNFSPGRIDAKEWTKTVKDLHFAAKKYFPCFEKGKRFS
jgi:hypothetical protein